MRSRGTARPIGLAVLACAVLGAPVCADVESTPLGRPEARTFIEDRPIGETTPGVRDPFEFSQYLETLLALGVVLGIAVAGSVVFKKFARTRGGLAGAIGAGGPSPSGVLEILGRYPIGAGQTLVLLRFDTRVLLLHQVGGRKNPSMRTISEVSDADDVASIMMKTRDATGDAADASFRETIRKMERGFGEPVPAHQGPVNQGSVNLGSTQRVGESGSTQQQIDLLVGDGPAAAGIDVGAIRGKLRGWVGAGS